MLGYILIKHEYMSYVSVLSRLPPAELYKNIAEMVSLVIASSNNDDDETLEKVNQIDWYGFLMDMHIQSTAFIGKMLKRLLHEIISNNKTTTSMTYSRVYGNPVAENIAFMMDSSQSEILEGWRAHGIMFPIEITIEQLMARGYKLEIEQVAITRSRGAGSMNGELDKYKITLSVV